jgi:hypothetical protein
MIAPFRNSWLGTSGGEHYANPLARPNGMKPNKTKDFDLRQA